MPYVADRATRFEEQAREATEWLAQAQGLNPHDPMIHVALGLTWHWLNESVKATREFEKAMDEGPRNVAVANHYAWDLLQQGRVRAARAIFDELVHSGEPCAYLDMTRLAPDFLKARFPTIYQSCLGFGVDLTRQPIPVAPAAHYCMGGIGVSVTGQTALSGLFAIGEFICSVNRKVHSRFCGIIIPERSIG